MKATVARLWAGELPLAQAFWTYTIVYGLLVNAVGTAGYLVVMLQDGPVILALVLFLLPAPYNLFVMVAVWRSADRYRGPARYADLARIAAVVWAIAMTVT